MDEIPCVEIERPSVGPQSLVMPVMEFDLNVEMDSAEPGDVLKLTFCMMTQEELDALPEFEGW